MGTKASLSVRQICTGGTAGSHSIFLTPWEPMKHQIGLVLSVDLAAAGLPRTHDETSHMGTLTRQPGGADGHLSGLVPPHDISPEGEEEV